MASGRGKRAVVVVAHGAGAIDPADLERRSFLIAADGGAESAIAQGAVPDLVVGDLDSLGARRIDELRARGVRFEEHPRAKDETDLELALACALRQAPDRILVAADPGGRLDHLFGVLTALAGVASPQLDVDAVLGPARVHVVAAERSLVGRPGELLSLFAVGADAHGVRTSGLLYPLRGETLSATAGRGVSNEFADEQAEIAVERGTLLAIRPGAR
ncbi:MAG TPA: thiamine diphosphokinase [Gaiellaceae bacterium]|nr:thiamine diphosphokinase [Gaiellaceae bacterium]